MTDDAKPRPAAGDGSGTVVSSTGADTPVIRVVRGVPTAEELAALVGVVAARAAATVAPPRPPVRPLWIRKEAAIGAALSAGPGAWRASGLPR